MNNSQTNDSNPCCSGQWSRTYLYTLCNRIYMVVLILIVVEDDLVLKIMLDLKKKDELS